MSEPMHPSNLSEILDRTAQLYRSRFLVFAGIAVIPTAAVLIPACAIFLLAVLWGAKIGNSFSPAVAGSLAVVFFAALALVAAPIWLAVAALTSAAMSHAAARACMDEKTTIRDAYKSIWRRGWHYIGLYVVQTFLIWGVPFAVWFLLVGLATVTLALVKRAGAETGALFGFFAFLVVVALIGYGLLMLLRLSLAFSACVVEQIDILAALKRSSRLSIGSRGRIFLLYLLGAALSWIVSIGITIPLTLIIAMIPGTSSPQHAQAAATVIAYSVYGAAFAVQALIKPVYGIALMLFYYDQRIRQEGFDIEWMMQRAGLEPAQAAGSEAPQAIDSV
jgi:hypothetical protein